MISLHLIPVTLTASHAHAKYIHAAFEHLRVVV